MNRNIRYGGYTANTSERDCADGDLSLSLGVVCENNALVPISQPQVICSFPAGHNVMYVHETSSYTNYIICNDSGLMWCSDKDTSTLFLLCKSNGVLQICSLGNTLIVLSEDGMQYFLWKKSEYSFLGSHLPELDLSFGLQATIIRGEQFDIDVDGLQIMDVFISSAEVEHYPFTDEQKDGVTGPLLAKVNRFIAEQAINKGKFVFPFFVRYAYRLFDGSLTMHSSPILMVCTSDAAPQCFVGAEKASTFVKTLHVQLAAALHDLDYAATNKRQLETLKKWNDVIKSVDIFVSKPIYTYDQNGKCTGISKTEVDDGFSICKNISSKLDPVQYPQRYQERKFTHLYAETFDPDGLTKPANRLKLPTRDEEAINGDVMDNQLFYLLKSINVEDISTERTVIKIGKEYLQSLVNREVMTDDYDSHDTLMPAYAYVYNARCNMANLKKHLCSGYGANALFCHTDGYVTLSDPSENKLADTTCAIKVYYFIKIDGGDKVVASDIGTYGNRSRLLWLYYPNVSCYKAVIEEYVYAGDKKFFEVQMNPHPTLNGAFYFSGWTGISEAGKAVKTEPPVSSISDLMIDIKNKIYTSEVNDPFFFPVLGINTLGVGEIFGLSSATRALSQGQFGQFPLYAFSSDGVWALEVSAKGTYSAKQPVTREVCVDKDSITQTDTAVLFASRRGIMLLAGAETKCISNELADRTSLNVHLLHGVAKIVDIYNRIKDSGERSLSVKDITIDPLQDFMVGLRMAYDSQNRRIIAYRADRSYAYVYSMNSGKWGMLLSNYRSNINAYPETMVMDNDNNLLSFSTGNRSRVTAMVMTRSLHLAAPDILKKVKRVIQRGILPQNGKLLQVLFGSNDSRNWLPVWNSTELEMNGLCGASFKSFRLLVIAPLDADCSLSEASFEFDLSRIGRIR